MHSEYSTLVDYLEWIADLPWNRSASPRRSNPRPTQLWDPVLTRWAAPPRDSSSDARISIAAAEAQLADDHFGMAKVSERVERGPSTLCEFSAPPASWTI